MDNKDKALKELKELLKKMKEEKTIGLDVEGADEFVVDSWKSTGYDTAGKFRSIGKGRVSNLDFQGPEKSDEHIRMMTALITYMNEVEPEKGKLTQIIEALKPWGSWASLAFTILNKYGFL